MKTSKMILSNCLFLTAMMVAISSCSSNKDIYRNPYQHEPTKNPRTNSPIPAAFQASQMQQPAWIYAVSKDFVVGYGTGKDIIEAKNSALNDIKSFIIKSLGETGEVVEVNFVKNSVTGRNTTECQEVYLLKNHFENQYRPVINISPDRFTDYYYEKTGSTAKYYILYNIDNEEIGRLKKDYLRSVQENRALTLRKKRILDSLITLQGYITVESLTDRYSAISNYLQSEELDRNDSMQLVNSLKMIRDYLNSIEIRTLEHVAGERVIFALVNGQTPVTTNCNPGITYTGIIVDSLRIRNENWELYYKTKPRLIAPGILEIYYNLPFKRLTSIIEVPVPITKPLFEITGQVHCSNFSKDFWKSRVRGLRISMNIFSNSDRIYMITDFDLLLHVNNNITPKLEVNDFVLTIKPGLNRFTKTILCDLPVQCFLTPNMTGDLILYYSQGKKDEMFNIKDLSLNIQNY